MKTLPLIFTILLAAVVSLNCQAPAQKALNVTVYNNDLGVVKDVRTFDIKSGTNEIRVTDVAERIDPTSVHIKLDGSVIEQNYQYDLVSMDKILKKYIDKEIILTGEKDVINGTLLSINGSNVVLRTKTGGLTMIPDINKYQIAVGSLPEGLITMPTLIWKISSARQGSQDVELSYQTGGMNWHAEYVAVLNESDTKIDLNSWVSIENNSGATYNNAVLKLIAGDVNRIRPSLRLSMDMVEKSMGAGAEEPQFQERSFFEYHIYDLQRPATLANNETKQISLFEAENVNVTKKYLYRSGGNYYPVYDRYGQSREGNKVAVAVEFENKKDNNMGMPMPAGKVRIYKADGKTIEFIGEDMMNHTPKNEKLLLKVGNAFDIVAEEQTVDQRQISERVNEYTYEIKFRNRKDQDVTIDVEKYLGYNWEVLSSSVKWEKKNAQTITFRVPVKKNDEETLTFRVRFSH